jgi:hypothetical protein
LGNPAFRSPEAALLSLRMVSGGRGKQSDAGDDDEDAKAAPGRKRRFSEFECPSCSAHNPIGDAFGNGDDLFCGYCGQSFVAIVDEDGGLRLKET